MLVSLTVGKVDAGVAVLLTEDKRLIEFPSILLPPSITSGSIVDITVAQNHDAERKSQATFESLQSKILNTYGLQAPATPELRLRNATQSTIVLEWDAIQLATTTLRSLALYRNGQKAGNIPRPMDMLSTKISGLQLNTEYSFHLVLRTSGGTYTSNVLTVMTHDMNNLTGIRVTPGVLPPQLRESLEGAVERIGAKIVDTPRIDTTHFVCTEGRGKDWERANEMNIPVVRPEWIEGCEREGKIIGVRGYYLDANPKHRQIGSNPSLSGAPAAMASPASQQAMAASQQQLPIHPQEDPKSPDRESAVSGEPGPEVNEPPTPPPKDEYATARPSAQDDDEDDSDDDAEDPEKPRVPEERTTATSAQELEEDSDDDDPDDDPDDDVGKGKSPEDTNKDKGNEMEDVAL